MTKRSTSVIQALDQIQNTIAQCCGGGSDSLPCGTAEYQQLAIGPFEKVFAFNNDETIQLHNDHLGLYFSSHGVLTDLCHKVLPGSKVETTFPVDPNQFPDTVKFPPKQDRPYDLPPLDPTNTTGNGYSKQAYYLNSHDSFVTVGPSLPKIAPTKNGGAQFWVGSIGVISQGTGIFEGAKGVTTYVGSGYFDHWPKEQKKQLEILSRPFKAQIGTFVKAVLRHDLHPSF